MSLIVTGVGFIIHVYSIGYMHGDKSFGDSSLMNLFIFAMMNLVTRREFSSSLSWVGRSGIMFLFAYRFLV
ncbi:MAG: hypothetical protein U5J96_08640 [Ignavibacteriaceae bacterium]|nr:hypothetical protein [Ignavibacteriaceae bacterium]